MKTGSFHPGFSKPLIPTGPAPELKIPKGSLPAAEGKPTHLPGEAIKELTKDCCDVKKPGGKHADSPIKDGMTFPDKPTKGPDCDKGANVKPGSVKSGVKNASAEIKKKMELMNNPNISEEMKSRIMMNVDDPARYEGMKKIQPK